MAYGTGSLSPSAVALLGIGFSADLVARIGFGQFDIRTAAGGSGSQDEPKKARSSYTATAGTAVVHGYRRSRKKIDGFVDWSRILEPLPTGAWVGEEPTESGTESSVARPEEADKLPSQQLLQAVERVERLPGSQPLVAPDLQISPVAAARAAAEFDDEEALVMLLLEI